MDEVLRVTNLNIGFVNEKVYTNVVNHVNISIKKGEAVALVGESGCGKSLTAMSVMRLLKSPPARIEADEIIVDGVDINTLSERLLWKIRGTKAAMIFQEPMTSLNPVTTIGKQLTECIREHLNYSQSQARERALQLLTEVGIPDPKRRMKEYPHQMSGGMRQRVMIAMALSCNPKLLLADEPTTALDVTIQAQILELIRRIRAEHDMALLLISHNMGIVAESVDRVMVMYAGEIVEIASTQTIFDNPLHPYTVGLLRSIPGIQSKDQDFYVIRGRVPNPLFYSPACRFASRCDRAQECCKCEKPELHDMGNGHFVRCHFPESSGGGNE